MTTGIGSSCETRFMHINSLALGTLTGNSGNLSGFPASNLASSNRGSLWVCGGNFEITSSNNKIYIGGSTYTLTNASYTAASLISHINTVIFSGTGLSLTYTTSYKFRWTNASGSTRTLNLSNQTNAVWSTIGLIGSVDVNILNAGTLDGEIRIHTSEYLNYDLGMSMNVDFFGLLPQRNFSNPLTSNATINVKASNINDKPSAPLSVNVTPGDEGTFAFLETGTPLQYRYVWITITDIDNPYGPNLAFSQIFLGGYTAVSGRTVSNGFSIMTVDRALRTESQAGGLYFERYGRHRSFSSLRYTNLNRLEIKTLQQLFFDIGKSTNFYLSLDSGNLNSDITEFTDYGVFDVDPLITKSSANLWDASFEFRSN